MSELIDFALLKASNALPSPKGVMLNVMRLCQREQVSLVELARQIQADPVLAGRIIHIANNLNPNRARSFAAVTTDALILIGVQAVRQVVLGVSLVTSYASGGCSGFDYGQFWSRSVASACAAQALAGLIRIAPVAELFTCGLLSGIGRLGLASARPLAYADLLAAHRDRPADELVQAELQLFGFSHLTLAVAMMADWSIPRLFCDAVLFHEAPAQAGFAEGSRQQRLTWLLQMAASIADLCIASDDRRVALCAPLMAQGLALGLDAADVTLVLAQTSAAWVDWGDSLQVQTRPLPLFSAADPA